ncbi:MULTISPECIES: cytochrome D1 domain-containing protein [Pandoraea]|uniref:40-residue YVTN family beta-propeller repeat protein n=1 Tax=Pandoraea commovens TaxID=2508289 RepID=A0A5E4RHS1_9BURK|nr:MULTISPECIES: beta-propeller fold lactonase family protein [Pandoraea]VVD61559.1 40-residue YVTN family beta-propeller repeat protein [Pandoraea commovens]VVE74896.1 40-residue YVTN family beta-propeller repeat protein [Pandoraea sputorum]
MVFSSKRSKLSRLAGRARVATLSLLAAAVLPLTFSSAHAGTVIVLDSGAAQLSLIDQASHKVIGTMPTGKEPHHLMITPDKRSLIVANSVSNSLMFLDPNTGKFQRQVADIDDPYQLGFSPDHKWFVTAALRLDRVDLYHYDGENVTVAKRIPLAKTPSHMTFSSDSKTVFVTLQDSGELAAIDLATQTVKWRMPVGKTPAGLWMTPGDKYLLVGMTGEDDVAVVDWRAQKVVKRIQTGRGAHNFRSLSDGRHIAVSNRVESTISILDYESLTKVADLTGLMPGPDDMELSADKRYLWVTFRFARHVGVIDLTTRKLVDTIAVNRSPHGIYFADRAPVLSPNPD